MLYNSNSIPTIGSVDTGSTTTDFLEEERARGITIQSATVSYNWNDSTINLIDTPGHLDFTNDVEMSMSVIDGLILVICASSGVQTQTKTIFRQMNRYAVPGIIFINKMDKDNAHFMNAFKSVKSEMSGLNPVIAQLPLGLDSSKKVHLCGGGSNFCGALDLITGQVSLWETSEQSCRKYFFGGVNGLFFMKIKNENFLEIY